LSETATVNAVLSCQRDATPQAAGSPAAVTAVTDIEIAPNSRARIPGGMGSGTDRDVMFSCGGTPLDLGLATLVRVSTRVRLTWTRFKSLTAVRRVFGAVSCVYVQADRGGRAVRSG
jgi:hypothetical protein